MVGELEADVQRTVQTVNTALKKIAQLNTSITAGRATGKDTTALEDERDRQVDLVNGIVPIRAKDRDEGGMMVSTAGGALLVEGSAREIEWVSGTANFTISGMETSAKAPYGGLMGGTLEASVTALTETVPAFMAQVDALAADLVKRFQNLPGYDTATSTLAGLFTDAGQRFDELSVTGLSGRIRLHAAVDPAVGGSPAELMTGSLSAVTDPLTQAGITPLPLPATPETFPTALMTAMRSITPSGIAGVSGDFTATDMAINLVAMREVNASERESEASFQQAASSTVRERELSLSAVDTDAELQALLRLEQAYAANARILEVTNGLINRLLEM
jgi:flagellar hook-associated protein 1 FlgK